MGRTQKQSEVKHLVLKRYKLHVQRGLTVWHNSDCRQKKCFSRAFLIFPPAWHIHLVLVTIGVAVGDALETNGDAVVSLMLAVG